MPKTEAASSTARVSSKGWVVIPAQLRRRYGIEPGQRVRIVDYGGVLGVVPELEDPVREGRGTLADERTSLTGALLDERRRERERDEG